MARLWEVAYHARRTIRFGAIGLVVLIVGRVALGMAVNLYRQLNPAPPTPPTVGFSQLPPLLFPKQTRPAIQFRLETVSGTVPTPSDRATVYLMDITRPNLLGLERGTEMAASLGFLFEPEALTERLYRFSRTTPIPSRLDYDIVTGNFKMRVDWFDKPDFLKEKFIPDEKQALSEVRNYLNKADLLPNDINDGENIITFLAAKAKGYKEVGSLSEADFVQIDLFRASVDEETPNITSTKDKGVIRVILSGSRGQNERAVQVEYDYFPINLEASETYPIKSGVAAWEELINGGGHILSSPQEGTVTVRKAYLAYYDSFDPQNYFQPVYVFEGDGDFKAMVPAIDPVWVQAVVE